MTNEGFGPDTVTCFSSSGLCGAFYHPRSLSMWSGTPGPCSASFSAIMGWRKRASVRRGPNDEKRPADTIGAAVMIATGEIRDYHSADYVGGAPLAFRASGQEAIGSQVSRQFVG